MLSTKSSHIKKLYKNSKWKPILIQLIKKIIRCIDSDIEKIIEINLNDKKIVEQLSIITASSEAYSTQGNINKAFRKWNTIKPNITTSINGILDFGGGVGDAAFAIGREILKLPIDRTYVIDVDEFGGIQYEPRPDITFIHYDKKENLNKPVDLIMISHVMHHIDNKLYPEIIEFFNKILSSNGIIMLYEHECNHDNIVPIINLEHCLYDVAVTKKMKYDKFVDTFYAKYLSIKKWESVFGKYFTPFNTIKLNNVDNSFYMFFKKL